MPGPNKNATTCKLNFFTKEFQLLRSSIFVFFCIILHQGLSFPYVFSMYLRNFQLSMHYIVFANRFRFRPTSFGCHKRLEGGCLRVTLNPGDVFAMPSQYIHTVLTSGDSVAVGTNFLSEGHSNQIMKAIIEEDSVREHEKFPGMLKMLAILMLKASERCMITLDFLRLHRVIENGYQESEAVAVSCIF